MDLTLSSVCIGTLHFEVSNLISNKNANNKAESREGCSKRRCSKNQHEKSSTKIVTQVHIIFLSVALPTFYWIFQVLYITVNFGAIRLCRSKEKLEKIDVRDPLPPPHQSPCYVHELFMSLNLWPPLCFKEAAVWIIHYIDYFDKLIPLKNLPRYLKLSYTNFILNACEVFVIKSLFPLFFFYFNLIIKYGANDFRYAVVIICPPFCNSKPQQLMQRFSYTHARTHTPRVISQDTSVWVLTSMQQILRIDERALCRIFQETVRRLVAPRLCGRWRNYKGCYPRKRGVGKLFRVN